ncbi:MAG: MmgE/PrpD family protein [Pseudomonadota bacterium]
MTQISSTFARYALTQSVFSDSAYDAAKTFLLDSLGVGIAGAKAPFQDSVHAVVRGWGEGGGAHLWGHGTTAPQASAAYLNGFQIHSMEYDCVHEPAVVHPMATILAAVSSEVEARGKTSGFELMEALIVAVDVAAELGVAVKSPLKFFRPATAGLFGATLGIARLRGFDEATALSAMGCALAQCAGVMQAHVEGKPTLPVQIAGAARAAVVACDLSQGGLHGPEHSLEGPFGYFAMFEDEVDVNGAAQSLGKVHRITEVSWKPFPTGRAAQGGIPLVQRLLEQGVTAENLESLDLQAPPIIPRLVARPAMTGMSPNYARLCFPYLAAVTLTRGTVGLDDFMRDSLDDPDFLALAGRVSVTANHVEDPAAFVPQSARAVLKDGSERLAMTAKLYGSPADPLSREAHLAKFRRCVAFGLSDDKAAAVADALIARTDSLERFDDVRNLFRLAAGVLE